ncbi:Amine oxidase, partial [Trinorchestia longiramus]
DVVVVGAGLAGLTAARTLLSKEKSLQVLVVEARDRVGGRTCTLPVKAKGGKVDYFDFGAQWVGPTQHHLLRLIKELQVEIVPQFSSGTKLMQVTRGKLETYEEPLPTLGSERAFAEHQDFMNKLESMAQEIQMDDPYCSPLAAELDGITVRAFGEKHLKTKEARGYLDQMIKGCFGADAVNMTMLFFLAYANASGGVEPLFGVTGTAQDACLRGGTQQLSQKLSAIIGKEKIMLSHAVVAVRQLQEPQGIQVEFRNVDPESNEVWGPVKQVTCRKVVMASPPRLTAQITFSPALPVLKKELYDNMHVGHLYKFLVTYEQPHWRNKGFSGEFFSNGGPKLIKECSTGPICEVYDMTTADDSPAVVGFLGGRTSIEWRQMTKAVREKAVIQGLVECFGAEMKNYIAYEDKMWGDDPWSGGCPVAFPAAGNMFAWCHVRTPHGHVHFAGTETATEWMGYMSGAIQSGERAAVEVLADLRPEVLTLTEKEAARAAR